MADVNPQPPSQPDRLVERGQLIAITGVLLAVTLVLLAVILNGVIYAGNLGTRGSDIGGSDVSEFENTVATTSTELIRSVNADVDSQSTTYAALKTALADNLIDWHRHAHRHMIGGGVYTNATITGTTNGSRIVQSDENERAFTDANDDNSWTLAEDVQVRNYTISASSDGLAEDSFADLDSDPTSGSFQLNVSTDDDGWKLYIYENTTTGHINVAAQHPNDSFIGPYETGAETARIDFTDATINGEFTEVAIFADGLEPPYTISYDNGNEIQGTYSLITDDPDVDSESYNESAASPYVVPAIYATNVSVQYESAQIEYGATVHVVPREHHD